MNSLNDLVTIMLSFTQKHKEIILKDSKYCHMYRNGFLEDIDCYIRSFSKDIKSIKKVEKLENDIDNLKNDIKKLKNLKDLNIINILDRFESIRQILLSQQLYTFDTVVVD